jgi:hypothetical protein
MSFYRAPSCLPAGEKGHLPATRSVSGADPSLAEQLSGLPNPKNNLWNTTVCPFKSKKIALLKREEGMGHPLDLQYPRLSEALLRD